MVLKHTSRVDMTTGDVIPALLSGHLVGDVVEALSGSDISVRRYHDASASKTVQIGSCYSYAHSTIAFFRGCPIGTAKVYVRCGAGRLTHSRMRDTLHQLGYAVADAHYEQQSRKISRVIVAPNHDAKIVIVETLHIDGLHSAMKSTGWTRV